MRFGSTENVECSTQAGAISPDKAIEQLTKRDKGLYL